MNLVLVVAVLAAAAVTVVEAGCQKLTVSPGVLTKKLKPYTRTNNKGKPVADRWVSLDISTPSIISVISTLSTRQSVLVGPDQVQLRHLQERRQAVRLPHAQVVPGWQLQKGLK